ncbi:uncharacterized protein LOC119027506 [Acanthopagrus latus]|uniref:uncharacterized protein LOC119027506 n=1 Tax=Acanthopagrus latus TaxID=8177 RepID=UPI00187C2F95|nr:uncharacterized protein LOC119027506 [Acanthopagrus latus]
MKNFTLIAALTLCSFSWISASASQSQTVEAQPGEEVTLQCMNTNGAVIFWFRLVNRTKVSCVSVKIQPADAQNCEGFGNGRFEMRSSNSTVSLKISYVAKSDAGLYFCGFYTGGDLTFNVVYLDVKGSDESHDDKDSKGESDRIAMLTSAILGALTVVLILVIIGLVVKVRKLQTAVEEEQNPEQIENVGRDDDVNYAAVTIRPKAKRREPEPNVIYASTR